MTNFDMRAYLQKFLVNGYVVLPDLFDPETVKAIENEFDILAEREQQVVNHTYENGFYIAVHSGHVASQRELYPLFTNFLLNREIQILIAAYLSCFYGEGENVPIPAIHQQLDLEANLRPGGTNNSEWHYDRMPAVKCALFLTDVNEDCGPFTIVPGSHFQMREVAHGFLEKNPDPLYVDNFIDLKSEVETETFMVPAGTVIVFDTFVVHKGGNITGNGRRKAIRTVTWPPVLTRSYFKPSRVQAPTRAPLEFSSYHPHDRTGQKTTNEARLYQG